ncbi:amidohydrolase family protein [Ferrovibrio sp.]|uniref:amidohydrolase family protein n=1 Tax=Ferrovibrio sp. TaxID=1917215 RepID=UPI001B561D4A|nr:amidohydrolase family protein [Ferrovibrio sp.]MBP7064497.1 amidohydrolase family protein [Ferrovibrio sp.]
MSYTRILTGPKPKLAMPQGATDTHIHFYDSRYAALPNTPTPPDASVADYAQVMDWLGIQRVVVVQPNAYGDDNRLTMDSVAQLNAMPGIQARAVAVVKPAVSDAELARLTEAGARGLRIMALLGGTLGLDMAETMAARVAPFGWHLLLQLDGRDLHQHAAMIRRLPCKVVIDHIGKFLEPVPPEHEGFRALLDLLAGGNVWVKLSAAYETSKTGAPHYEDVSILARALVRAAPERMIWASNFPHAQAAKFGYPDDAAMLDLLLDWAPNEADRHKILVDNPSALYDFA